MYKYGTKHKKQNPHQYMGGVAKSAIGYVAKYGPKAASMAYKAGKAWYNSKKNETLREYERNKPKTVVIAAGGTSEVTSFYYKQDHGGKIPKGLLATEISKNYYNDCLTTRLTVPTIGTQNYGLAASIYTPGVLQSTLNFINTANKTQNFLLNKCTVEIHITNTSPLVTRIDLYDIIPHTDGNTSITDPVYAMQQGYADLAGGGSPVPTTLTYQYLGTTPYQLPKFYEFFKIHKVRTVMLGPGAYHIHKVTIVPKHLINAETFNFIQSYIKNMSYFCMLRFHGQPTNDTITKTQISTTQSALDVVTTYNYEYQWYFNNVEYMLPVSTATGHLPTAYSNAESAMDPLIGNINTTNSDA